MEPDLAEPDPVPVPLDLVPVPPDPKHGYFTLVNYLLCLRLEVASA